MPIPIRNITQAQPGQITATSSVIKNRLAIRLTKITGVKGRGRGKR